MIAAERFQAGDVIAVFDGERGRWVSARVIAASLGKLIVATATGGLAVGFARARAIRVVGA